MKHPARSALSLALSLGLVMTLSGSRPVVAQNTTTTAAAAQGTPLEQEALRLYNENKLLTARTKAEQALRADPDSLIGNYVMGCVLREA